MGGLRWGVPAFHSREALCQHTLSAVCWETPVTGRLRLPSPEAVRSWHARGGCPPQHQVARCASIPGRGGSAGPLEPRLEPRPSCVGSLVPRTVVLLQSSLFCGSSEAGESRAPPSGVGFDLRCCWLCCHPGPGYLSPWAFPSLLFRGAFQNCC